MSVLFEAPDPEQEPSSGEVGGRWLEGNSARCHHPPTPPVTLPPMLVLLQVLSVSQNRATAGKWRGQVTSVREGFTYNEAALWRRGDKE